MVLVQLLHYGIGIDAESDTISGQSLKPIPERYPATMSTKTSPPNNAINISDVAPNIDAPSPPEEKTRWPQWAIVVLLSILIALSGAQLLGTVLLELVVDYKAGLLRVAILLPVLVIASFLLLKHWQKLIAERSKTGDKIIAKEE